VALFGFLKTLERDQKHPKVPTDCDAVGWRTVEQITDLIDRYFDHVVLPASLDAREIRLKYHTQLPIELTDETVVQTLSAHDESLDEFNQIIRQGAYEGLGELRYLAAETGIKDHILAYIDRRADELMASMREPRQSSCT
jgi:hypothetical protein